MAYTSVIPVRRLDRTVDYVQNKEKTTPKSLEEAVDYAANRDKTESACFETGLGCTTTSAFEDMRLNTLRWHKETGVQGYHLVQSFAEGEVTPELAHQIGVEFAEQLLHGKYQAIVTTHLNTKHFQHRVLGRLRCAAGGDGAAAFACGGDRTAGDPLFPFPLDGRPDGLCPMPGGAGAAGRRPHPGRPGAQGVPKGNVLVCFGRSFSACARPARPATVAPALDHPRPVERLFLLGRLAARSGQSHRNRLFPEPLCQGCPRQMEHAGASHCRNARQCCGRKADAQQAAKKLHKFMKPIHLILRIIFVR